MANDVEDGKICAALSYILIGIIWYFADDKMRQNKFANYHCKQGLVLLIISVALGIILAILSALFFALMFIPGIGFVFASLFWIVSLIIWVCFLILWLFGLIYALSGKMKPVPVVGRFGEKFTF